MPPVKKAKLPFSDESPAVKDLKAKFFAYYHGWCDAGGGLQQFINDRRIWKSVDFRGAAFFRRFAKALPQNYVEIVNAEWLMEFLEERNK